MYSTGLANQLQITSIPQVLNHNYKHQIYFYPTFQILFIFKLDSSNYVLWKYQIIPSILWPYSLLDFIDGTELNPKKNLLDKSGTTLKGENPLYQQRKAGDQALQTLINVTLSPLALSLVVEPWFWNLDHLMNREMERFKIFEVGLRFNRGPTVMYHLIF